MTTCSKVGCSADAVQQYQRQGTDWEAEEFANRFLVMQAEIANRQRVNLTLSIDQLHASLAVLETRDDVTEAMRDVVRGQIATSLATRDAIADPEPRPLEPVLMSVFACDDHKVDEDLAARVHDADCTVCACTDLAEPETVEP